MAEEGISGDRSHSQRFQQINSEKDNPDLNCIVI